MELKISKDIPLPRRFNTQISATLAMLQPNESVFIPASAGMSKSSLSNIKRSFPDRKFASRTVFESGIRGLRIWRTA